MQLSHIGYFSKTHGIKGLLVLKESIPFFVEQVKVLFIDKEGSMAPYFIKEIKQGNQNYIVSLEEVDSIEKGRALVGKKVSVDSSLINTEKEDEFSWLGYNLIDKNFGSLGLIEEVTTNGQQVLVRLNYQGKEILLPLIEDFIERVDDMQKKIFFNAPNGLIELYL